MMHKNRRFSISDVPEAELANKLVNYSWTLCTGFRCKGFLFLNDATSEDGAQEYAVIREGDSVQVESITFSWCSLEEAIGHIDILMTTKDHMDLGKVEVLAHHEGYCRLCA
jgi:hypothetical protein